MSAKTNWGAWNPCWAASYWGLLGNTAIGAGVTFVTSPAHPFASSLSERCVKIDMNDATGAMIYQNRYFDTVNTSAPDFTKRWGMRLSFLYQRNSTALSSSRVIVEGTTALSGPRDFILKQKTDNNFELYVDSSLVATTTTTLTAGVWYQLEIWEVWNNPDGSARSTRQWVVRAISSSSGTDWNSGNLTIQTLIDVDVSSSGIWSISITNIRFGETTANGAGALYYVANIVLGWEDADDPYGIIRVDLQWPNGTATSPTNEWNTVTAGGVNVDESGTAVPDDGTTTDSETNLLSGDGNEVVYYDTTSPSYITAGDSVIAVRAAMSLSLTLVTKQTPTGYLSLSTGSAQSTTVVSAAKNGGYTWLLFNFNNYPGSTGWAVADLTTLEMGVVAASTDAVSPAVAALSTLTAWVGYQKAGEKAAGLPRTRIAPALFKPAPIPLDTPPVPMKITRPWVGLMGAVVTPPVVSSRRRQSQII